MAEEEDGRAGGGGCGTNSVGTATGVATGGHVEPVKRKAQRLAQFIKDFRVSESYKGVLIWFLPCDEKSFSKRKSSMFMNSADMNSALAALAPEALGSACCL